jgi:hypothetical protein
MPRLSHVVQPPARLAHEKPPRPPLRGHEGEQTAQRSMADDRHRHALRHMSPLDTEQRAGQRLGEGGAPRGQRVAETNDIGRHEPGGKGDVFTVGAVDEEEILAEILALPTTEAAGAAGG